MQSAPVQGGANLARFRRLVSVSIAATFVLIVIGGIVRVSDSGLGCGPAGSGTEGWPLCEGRVVPFLQTHAVVEFSHRVAATVVALLMVWLAWRAWRSFREHRWLVRGSAFAVLLVLAQAVLGGLTVENNLHEALVAAHLGLAMLLLATLLTLRRATFEGSAAATPAGGVIRPLAVTAVVLLFATIVAGGYMAGTEGQGTPGIPPSGAHFACGNEFPTCLGGFMPFGLGEMVDVHLTHRAFMYLAVIATVALIAVAYRRGMRTPALAVALGLLALQVLLGALNVWLEESGALIVSHLTVATALWSTVLYTALQLVSVPVPGRAAVARPDTEPSSATA